MSEQTLRDSEERYRAFFQSMDDGFCIMQLLFDAQDRPVDYRFLETNAAFEAQTGLVDAVGKTARELVPDLDESWFRLYGQVALTGERTHFENHAPAMNRWFEVSASRVGRPELRQVALVFKNITERKEAELERERLLRELEAAGARLRTLFENAPAFVATLSGRSHIYEMVNAAYLRLVGGGRTLIGLPVREALPEVAEQGFITLLDRVYETGEPFIGREVKVQLARHSGQLEDAYATFVYQPTRNAQGEIVGIDAFGFDVSEQVWARRQVEDFAEQLRLRADFEQQLIGIVSHDLRNPITAILLGAAGLLRGDDLSEQQTRNAARIRASAERASRMIKDLLDFTQARLGEGIAIEPRSMELNQVVSAVLDEVQATHAGRELNVQLAEDTRGTWDPDRLEQVVQNLLVNALKYSPPETPVSVSTSLAGDQVAVVVHNDGEPISPERMAKVFEPLQRATTRPDGPGRSIGLGLYIVKKVVDAHGGTVAVESAPGRGTTFTVRLPRVATGSPRPPG